MTATLTCSAGRVDNVSRRSTSRRSPATGHRVPAVRGVSFTIREGETLGLVGESAAQVDRAVLLRLEDPTANDALRGHDLIQIRPRAMRELRRQMQ